jgi:Ca-activated chloride channel family protein
MEYIDRRTGRVVKKRIEMIESDLDEATLQQIASTTSGRFFRAHNSETLHDIYNQIDKLEKTEIKTKTFTSYSERFFPWLAAGAIIALLELLLANTRLRRIP